MFTHACFLNFVGDLHEQLLVLRGVFTADKDLDGESAAFELFEMFRCIVISILPSFTQEGTRNIPFLAVVRMYSLSIVKSISVVGNS